MDKNKTKVCSNCGVEKSVSDFSPVGEGRVHSQCKPCRVALNKWGRTGASNRIRKNETIEVLEKQLAILQKQIEVISLKIKYQKDIEKLNEN